MTEHWLPVPDHPGYEVSDLGRLRSAWERGGPRRWRIGETWTILAPARTGAGYLVAYMRNSAGVRKLWQVHQVVMLAFEGPCPAGQEVLHWNDVGDDNALANLRYGTRGDNRADQNRNSGPACGNATLTEADVRAIRADARGPTAVARAFGVSYDTVRNIRLNLAWSHVS